MVKSEFGGLNSKKMENYLQELSGESYDNINIEDVKNALKRLETTTHEHGVFWVSVLSPEENVLEIDKRNKIIGVFQDKPDFQYEKLLKNKDEAIFLFDLLLKGNFQEIKKHLL